MDVASLRNNILGTVETRPERTLRPSPRAEDETMAIGFGIFLMAVGAVMRFAVSVQTDGFNVHTIGLILMGAGAATVVLTMLFFGGDRRGAGSTTVTEPDTR